MQNCIFIRKSLLLSLFIVMVSIAAIAQLPRTIPGTYTSINHSYIRTWDAAAPEQTPNTLMTRPLKDIKQSTQYFDGLGRPFQTVVEQGSLITNSTPVDVISAVEYDALGHEPFKYLPTPSTATDATKNDGNFKFNPFTQQAAFYNNLNTATNPFAGQGETFFYGQTVFESSPLNRVTETSAPGNSWTGSMWNATEANRRSVKMKYYLNTATDAVRIWTVSPGAIGSFSTYASSVTYAAGLLYKNITVDEYGNQVIEFKDKDGKVILKKVQLSTAAGTADDGTGRGYTGWLSTYYIYDDLNNLRCVIQPRGVELISSTWVLTDATILSEQCFRYEYDQRNRMIIKKIPGAVELYMVYDTKDRLMMTQDANMRANNKWMVTLYDALNRPEQTGLLLNTWNSLNNTFVQHLNAAYNSNTYPFTSATTPSVTYWEELTRTFYDNYDWRASWSNPLTATYNVTYDTYFQTATNLTWPYGQANTQSAQLEGQVTGTRIKVLNTSTYLFSVNFYDDKGRVIQVQSQNITATTAADIVTTQYNWAGQPLVVVQKQEKAGTSAQTNIIVTLMTRDDLGRIIKTEKKLSNTVVTSPAITISTMEYDALGQIRKKNLGTNPANTALPLETVNYDYNIRGWLLGENRDFVKDINTTNYFGFDLGYDKNGSLGTYIPQYNGNISGTIWKSKGDNQKRKYDFTYDAVKRLTGAGFNQYVSGTGTSAIFDKSAGVDFSVAIPNYDANGNIMNMNQNGLKLNTSPLIDQLTYTYQTNANKLSKVTDVVNDNTSTLGDFKYDPLTKGTTDYSYDVNGNLTIDNNKKISNITYNHLNLPSIITVTGKGTITYTYDAAGNKLKKFTVDISTAGKTITTITTYINGFVFETKSTLPLDAANPDYTDVLQFATHEEGRIRKTSATTFAFDYFLKDHLGNVRMMLTDQLQTDIYPAATLETSKIPTEQLYYNIISAQIVDKSIVTGLPAYQNNNVIPNPPVNPPFDNANSAKLYKLNKNTQNMGLGITLRVMSGDKLDIYGKSYYFQNNTGGSAANTAVTTLNILAGLLGGPTGAATSVHGVVTAPQLNGIPGTTALINTLLGNQTTTNNVNTQIPKAFINYILFDEQFKSVGSGFAPLGANSVLTDYAAVSALHNILVPKNGFVYIYSSNESPVDVFFDNIQVVHTRSPILEETHYYPFGLTMSGISSKAAGKLSNKIKYNGKELQSSEFSDGSGLEWYDYNHRFYDDQIGRFFCVDGLTDKYPYYTPYQFAGNEVPNAKDLDGLEPLYVIDSKNPSNYQNPETQKAGLQTIKGLAILTITYFCPALGVSLFATDKTGIPSPTIPAPTSVTTTIVSEAKTLTQLETNAAKGKDFEKTVVANLTKEGHTSVSEQVTIKANGNGVSTKMDVVSRNAQGEVELNEAKSSATAPLTPNQKLAHPSIETTGGVVTGAGKPDFPGGTQISPTKVNIIRPKFPITLE